jgi:resuscitation-promoting factor RpfA
MARYRGRHRAPSNTGRTIARTAIAGAVAGAPLLVTAPAYAASDSAWDQLAECESGGRWDINTGNGYHGGLQFSPRTWSAFGGKDFAPVAYKASRAEQIVVAERVLAKQGWNAWPSCSRKTGVRGESASQRDAPARDSADRVRAASSTSTSGSYTVKSGDTLGRIAAANGVEGGWKALVEKNPALQRDPNSIFPGQKLTLGPVTRARGCGRASSVVEAGQLLGGVDILGRGQVAALDEHEIRVTRQVAPCSRVAGGCGTDACPVLPSEEDGVGRTAAVSGAGQRIGRGSARETCHCFSGDAGQIHQVYEHRVRHGVEPLSSGEPGAQRRAHALVPALGDDRAGVGRQQRLHLGSGRADDHHERRTAAVGEHAHCSPDERLPTERHERLGAAHPPARAGGEQQPCRAGYLLVSVTGCTYGTSSRGNSTSPKGESEPCTGLASSVTGCAPSGRSGHVGSIRRVRSATMSSSFSVVGPSIPYGTRRRRRGVADYR